MDYLLNAWNTSIASENCNCKCTWINDGLIFTNSKIKNRTLCIFCSDWIKDLLNAGMLKLVIDSKNRIHCWTKKSHLIQAI